MTGLFAAAGSRKRQEDRRGEARGGPAKHSRSAVAMRHKHGAVHGIGCLMLGRERQESVGYPQLVWETTPKKGLWPCRSLANPVTCERDWRCVSVCGV